MLSANTLITGIEVGVGSGWNARFAGAVDNVLISFGADTVSANFETAGSTAVPEPASIALLGVGMVAAAWRRRRAA